MKLSSETLVFFCPSYAMMGKGLNISSDPMVTRTEETKCSKNSLSL